MSALADPKMKHVTLGEVAQFIRGITFTPTDKVEAHSPGSAVCMRTANVQEELDESDLIAVPAEFVRREEQYLRPGDLLVSSANSWNLVGKCCRIPELNYRATAGGFISILRATNHRLDQKYLFYWFASDAIQHQARLCGRQTTNISNLDFERCLALTIPLPSLPEQKRIAAILDKADALRRKRREAADLPDRLSSSLFRTLFDKWLQMPTAEMRRLGDPAMSDIASGVTKGRRFNGQATVIVPYIRVANVQDGFLDLSEVKTIEALPSDLNALRLERDDLLMTEGGDFDKLGRGALWVADIPDCIHQNHVFRVRCNRQNLLPIYLAYYIRSQVAKAYFLRCAKKTSNLASMNMTQLRATPVACPPMALQERFAAEMETIQAVKTRQSISARAADDLFNSLVGRAFRGEL